MSDLDLLYSETEEDLRASVRALLGDHCDPVAVTKMYDSDRAVVDGLWKALVGLGLPGLLVSEEWNGQGASAREAAVVLEELGRAVAPVPFLTSSVVATTLLLEADAELTREVATGERTAALLTPWSTAPDGELAVLNVHGGAAAGAVTSVAGALEADILLAVVHEGDGLAVRAIDASDAEITPVVSLDMTRQLADVRLERAFGELVLTDAEDAVRRALAAGAALLASEQVGVARWCLESTLAYVKERRQFGRVVGGFQALKHRLADLYTGIESAAAAARYAAATLAEGDEDAVIAASTAQAFNADLTVLAAEEALQLHAGIGMTWEHSVHLYLKRAKADQIALGRPGEHRSRLASLIDLPS